MDRRCVTPQVADRAQALERRWHLDCNLAWSVAIVLTEWELENGRSADVISGYRTRAAQDELRRAGRPAADDHLSNHRVLPARAVDVTLGALPTNAQKARLGAIAFQWGLRWGGGSAVDPETSLPFDWNHLDLGPRPAGLQSGP